jgi:hypothetical protein
MTATLQHDRLTGRAWLEFGSRPDAATISALKASGWRWSGYRKQWHRPGRHTVPPAGIAYEDAGECDYSEERADRLEGRAERAREAGEALVAKAEQMAEVIPFGQPILVGHHSEGRDRRYRGRIDKALSRGFGELASSRRLENAADASRAHQEHLQSVGCIMRRLDRMRAELRALERSKARTDPEYQADDWDERIEHKRSDIAREEATLAELGGAPEIEVSKGDVIEVRGHVVRVARANRKTISGLIIQGGAAGMSGKWDRSWLQRVISKAG